MAFYRHISKDKLKIAYLLGIALGDGNLSNPNGRAIRLRITCDLKYPLLINKIQKLVQEIMPDNKVTLVNRKDNCLDVSCYSNQWEKILGWEAGKGNKLDQNILIPAWIIANKEYSVECLRGLIETDGSIYLDRGYKAVMFTNSVKNLATQVYEMMIILGFSPHSYVISKRSAGQQTIFRVRLTKNVEEFIKKVAPMKS